MGGRGGGPGGGQRFDESIAGRVGPDSLASITSWCHLCGVSLTLGKASEGLRALELPDSRSY